MTTEATRQRQAKIETAIAEAKAEVQAELETLRSEEVEFRRRERELQKEVTKEFRRKLATYKFGNSLFMPIVVILFGIGLAIYRKSKTAAR